MVMKSVIERRSIISLCKWGIGKFTLITGWPGKARGARISRCRVVHTDAVIFYPLIKTLSINWSTEKLKGTLYIQFNWKIMQINGCNVIYVEVCWLLLLYGHLWCLDSLRYIHTARLTISCSKNQDRNVEQRTQISEPKCIVIWQIMGNPFFTKDWYVLYTITYSPVASIIQCHPPKLVAPSVSLLWWHKYCVSEVQYVAPERPVGPQ